MHKFKDCEGREWGIAVNVSSVKRVKDALQLDLLAVADGKLLTELSDDPLLLCNVLYVLCEKQCEAIGVSDEQFGEGLAGDAIADATKALMEELVDFFPPGRREILSRALAKVQQAQAMALKRAEKCMQDSRIDDLVTKELDKAEAEFESRLASLSISGDSSTAPQESSV